MLAGEGYNRLPVDETDAIEEDNSLQTDNDESNNDSSDDSLIDSQAPQNPILHDKYRMIEIISGLLGLICCIPWNIFITATDCWKYKFRNVNDSSAGSTQLQVYFNSYLSMANNVPNILVVLFMIFYGHKITATIRSVTSMLIIMILMILSTVLVKVDSDNWQNAFFWIIIISVLILGLCTGILASSISGVVSSFPSNCIQAVVLGQAISGIFAVICQIISLRAHADPRSSAMYYFICADMLLIIAFVAYLIARKTPYYRFYRKRGMFTLSIDNISERSIARRSDLIAICRAIWPHLLAVFLILSITLIVYPPLLVLVAPKNKDSVIVSEELFLPIFCFLLFNINDLLGRLIGKWFPFPQSKPIFLIILAVSRLILVFGLMVCNIHPRNHLPVLFESEYIYAILVMLLGLSNGYGLTVSMFQAPLAVKPELQEKTGFIISAALGLGVFSGSIASNVVLRLI